MFDNSTQILTPQPLSHRALVASMWTGFTRADIIGTFEPDSLISEGITAAQAAILDRAVGISHTMLYLGRDQVLDQQAYLQVRHLEDYVGYVVRLYHNPLYGQALRDHVVAESMVFHLGSAYDLQIIPAHFLEAILGTDGLAEHLHDPQHFDCSEGVCVFMGYGDPDFMDGRSCQVMPAEIDQWCIEAGWQIRTYALTE